MLPFLLFAYSEVPHLSTWFALFDFLYGRKVRGPPDIIREPWEDGTQAKGEPEAEYVQKFREDLKTMMEIVQQNLLKN